MKEVILRHQVKSLRSKLTNVCLTQIAERAVQRKISVRGLFLGHLDIRMECLC